MSYLGDLPVAGIFPIQGEYTNGWLAVAEDL